MADYLLVRSGSVCEMVETLGVCAGMVGALGYDARVDIVTTEELKPYAKLSRFVRRVVAMPPLVQNAWSDVKDAVSGGGLFSSVQQLAATVTGSRVALGELRLAEYDIVFDFEATAFSLAMTKAAKTAKIVGFDKAHLDDGVPGATLAYHENHFFTGKFSHAELSRKLVARELAHSPLRPADYGLPLRPRPAAAPKGRYLLVSNDLPMPFVDEINDYSSNGEPDDCTTYPLPDDLPAGEQVAWVQHAAGIIGDEVVAGLATATAKETRCLYIGSERHCPEGVRFVSTPSDLAEALPDFLPAPKGKPAEAAPAAAQPVGEDSDDEDPLDDAPAAAAPADSPAPIKIK